MQTERSLQATESRRQGLLSGNTLKLVALVLMTIDHAGMIFGGPLLLRVIGRLSFPIFAYMLAEGCRYTQKPKQYLGLIFALGFACQLVYFWMAGSLYQCILITFSLGIVLIFACKRAQGKGAANWLLFALVLLLVYLFCEGLPALLPHTDFAVDYGFFGALLPLLIYLGRDRWGRLGMTALGLVLVNLSFGGIQWWSLLALFPLALYTGARGKGRLKNLFYIYYPTHLALLWTLAMLLPLK